MRPFRCFPLWLLLSGVPLSAQSPMALEPAPGYGSTTEPVAARAAEATRLGYSNAVHVLITRSAAVLGPDLLSNLGSGWEYGHRWVPLNGDRAGVLPGQPLGGPAERMLQIGEADSKTEVRAPSEPGVWLLESGAGSVVQVVTTIPASRARGGRLNGYHIGYYPTAGSGRTDAYAPPEAFIEVTPENRDLRVSRHLTLAQFITKDQFDVWPKYVALDSRLLDKLELMMQELNAMGVRAERLHVMSGFRTPQYNGPGGDGRATLSRHMWGDAADVWVDNDGDGIIDDLNGDGFISTDDAAVMLRAVERVERKYPELIGGAGVYPAAYGHGPFIHVDARGAWSRW